jgi:MFS family permease
VSESDDDDDPFLAGPHAEVRWVTTAGFVVGFSKLSDIYGRKNILAASWLLFTLGSVWCGIARRMGELYVIHVFLSPLL